MESLFHRQILDAAKSFGDESALVDFETGESLSFAGLRCNAVRLAQVLSSQYGLAKGHNILCVLPNSPHYPVILLAGAILGVPVTGMGNDLNCAAEVDLFLAKADCRAIFTSSAGTSMEMLATRAGQLAIPLFILPHKSVVHPPAGINFFDVLRSSSLTSEENIEEFLKTAPDHQFASDEPFVMPLSSGASGVPKIVILTHRNYLAATSILKRATFDELTRLGGGRRCTIAAQPFHHASGLWILCYCLLEGHRSIVMNRFSCALYLDIIEKERIDTLSLGPWLISLLLDANMESFDLSSVRTVISGGSSEATNHKKNAAFLAKFPNVSNFLIGYGMTEIVLVSHMTPLHMDYGDERRLRSVGQALDGFQWKIVDFITSGEMVNPHEQGELLLKSDCIMKGYLNDSENNEGAFDADGWFHTGDIVYRDEENFFFVMDRLANLILVGGDKKVWPAEIESVLLQHEDVLEACVIGADAESRLGQVPRAFLVVKEDSSKETLAEIVRFANDRLDEAQQLVGGVWIVETLPKTPFGKVAKQMVRDTMETMMSAGVGLTGSELLAELAEK